MKKHVGLTKLMACGAGLLLTVSAATTARAYSGDWVPNSNNTLSGGTNPMIDPLGAGTDHGFTAWFRNSPEGPLTVTNDLTPWNGDTGWRIGVLQLMNNTAYTFSGSDMIMVHNGSIQLENGTNDLTHSFDLRIIQEGSFSPRSSSSSGNVLVKDWLVSATDNRSFYINSGLTGNFTIDKLTLAAASDTVNRGLSIYGNGVSWLIINQVDNGGTGAGANGFTIWANARVRLTGANTYTGDTTLRGGLLIADTSLNNSSVVRLWDVGGSLIYNSADPLTKLGEWRRGTSIGGNGAIANAAFTTQNSGAYLIAPGDFASTGTLHFTNDAYTWSDAGAALQYNWDFDAAGNYDSLDFAGKLTLSASNYLLNVSGLDGADTLGAGVYTLIHTNDADSVLDLVKWDINWNGFDDDGGWDYTLAAVNGNLVLTVIPEPSAWTLLLTGVALLAACRRRR
ncbi:MAG: PEP-CTERM sorting domain-containing protein [Verrucomicrobiales bacterium]|jgi:autotransporter-associated beta strand protein|nr:PEP-CTERM sorting domain-containing protein [Verrucomicrobiales bacterium]